MNQRYTSFFLIAIVLFTGNQALALKISGSVKNIDGDQLPMVYVTILQQADKAMVQTGQTDDNGRFEYSNLQAGRYTIDIQALGYKNKKLDITLSNDTLLNDIVMEWQDNRMEEVVVTEKQDVIKTELGKTIVHVRENVKQGSTLLDILKGMPGVTVSGNGTVSIDGKQGIVVLIDDKPTNMEGKELTEYLKSVDASEVANVELMSQPSAKYDAAGNSGIINIKMTKNKKEGWNGTASASYEQGRYPFKSLNSNIAYKRRKATYTLSPGYYIGQGYMDYTKTTIRKENDIPVTKLTEESYRHETFPDYSLKTGIDYDLSEKTNVYVTAKGIYHTNKETDRNTLVITDIPTGTNTYNNTTNNNGHKRHHIDVNMFAKHEPDSLQKIEFYGGTFITNRDLYQDITSNNYNYNGLQQGETYLLNNTIPDRTNLYTAKLDYTLKGKGGKELECGIKSSYATMNEANIFEEYVDGRWTIDTNRSNRFLYNENINAAYASGSMTTGKFSLQTGLRVEHTHATGDQITQNLQFTQDYISLFPTAFVTYKADDNNSLELNYNKRLQRPYYRELNPFTSIATPYSYHVGNPLLRPQFTHNVELKHNYKGRFITVASFSKTLGTFMEMLVFEKATNTSINSTVNNGTRSSGALSAFFNNQLTDWLHISTKGNISYMEIAQTQNNKPVKAYGIGYHVTIDTQFSFKKGWAGNFHGGFNGPYRNGTAQIIAGSVWMNADVSKRLFKDTTTIKVRVQDPFNLYRYTDTIDLGDVVATTSRQFNVQSFAISLSYNFGTKEENQRRTEMPEETRRM